MSSNPQMKLNEILWLQIYVARRLRKIFLKILQPHPKNLHLNLWTINLCLVCLSQNWMSMLFINHFHCRPKCNWQTYDSLIYHCKCSGGKLITFRNSVVHVPQKICQKHGSSLKKTNLGLFDVNENVTSILKCITKSVS